MELLNQMMANGMQIVQARIINIGNDGKLLVKTDSHGTKISCDFLRTSAGPLPQLYLGTPVLCIVDENKGYILGVIQPYLAPDGQDDQKDEKKIDPKQLNLKAVESIELTCGESMLSMDKNGKIVLRGADITTRSSGPNKIKGATIRLN